MGQDAAVAPLDEKILDAGGQKPFAAAIHGVALADAAQVEPHARIEKADGLLPGVQLDQVAADVPAGLGQLLAPGHGPGAAGEAPDFPERAGGDVIRPAALLADPHGEFEQLEQPRLDRHGPRGRRRIDPRQLAVGAEDRQLGLQLLDQVEGIQGGLGAMGILTGAETDLELAGHGGPRYPHQVRLAFAGHRRLRNTSNGFSSINSARPASASSRPVT